MIRILYGAGSDSTARTLLDAIRQDIDTGKRAILLVPEQEAVSAERRLLHALPPSSQLRFEVLNFTRLANRVFRTVGGLAKRYASPAVSALFMWRTLHSLAGALSCYSAGAALDPRLTDRMLSAAAQFKAYCVSPDMLLDAADRLEKEDPLRDKLSDLGLVISTYDRALGAAFADSADALKDGKIDAAFIVAGAPTPAITELCTTNKEAHLLPIDGDLANKLINAEGSFYTAYTIPANTYANQTEDVTTITVKATLIVDKNASEDDVYKLTAAIFDNVAAITEEHAKGAELTIENATSGMAAPFHKGAAKYFAEKNVTVTAE